MKILVLAWEFPPRIIGGIARHVAGLFPEIVRLGGIVHLLTVAIENSSAYEIVDGIHVHRLEVPEQRDFFQWVRLMNQMMVAQGCKIALSETFDLIHAHDWLVSEGGIILSQKLSLPLVATIHATEYGRHNGIHTDSQRYVSDQERQLGEAARRVIVCSQYMLKEVERALGCPATKVDVIYNGINTDLQWSMDDFDRGQWRLQFAPPDSKIIYYVGRLAHEKGIFVLLNSLPRVLEAMAGKVCCVIVGTGSAQEVLLKRQAEHLRIRDKVIFTGFMPDRDLPKLRSVADCAVFPSLYEPFGIVALESFAAGVPVVVSDTGGMPEVVENGVTGVVTRVNNAHSLAEGILQVLQNEELAHTLVSQAHSVLSDKFNWQKLALQTLDTYYKSLAQGGNDSKPSLV